MGFLLANNGMYTVRHGGFIASREAGSRGVVRHLGCLLERPTHGRTRRSGNSPRMHPCWSRGAIALAPSGRPGNGNVAWTEKEKMVHR
jgi:hypothetical protein